MIRLLLETYLWVMTRYASFKRANPPRVALISLTVRKDPARTEKKRQLTMLEKANRGAWSNYVIGQPAMAVVIRRCTKKPGHPRRDGRVEVSVKFVPVGGVQTGVRNVGENRPATPRHESLFA
jgi:hypothetical protein